MNQNYKKFHDLAPTVVSVSSIRFAQLMKILLALHHSSLVVCSVQKLKSHLVGQMHSQLLFPRGLDQPLTGQIVGRLL